jgi:spore germination protein
MRIALITLLSIVVIGTGYWGYKEHQEKNAILIQAENRYQQSFHDLTYHVDSLQNKIGTTLAMNSREQLSPALAEVWRITSEAHNDVGQLPLALLPFNKTEEFLTQIGDFSYRIAIRDLDKSPLTDSEYKTLSALYKDATEIRKELRKVQEMALENNLRWMDVEMALATNENPEDNTIINGFKTVDKNVEGYSDVDWGPELTQIAHMKDIKYDDIKGEPVSESKAKKLAKKFLNLGEESSINVVENGKGSDYDAYTLTIKNEKLNSTTFMEITKKGGHPVSLLTDREVGERKLSLYEGSQKALSFLEKHMYDGIELTESDQYDNVGVYSFVQVNDGVRIFPQSVKVKVALDNGAIVGYDSMNYLLSDKDREIPEPKLSKEEVIKKLNPNLKIMEEHLSIIANDLGEEVLCYEFFATLNEVTYRIFVNADTAYEEKVETLGRK